MLPLEPGRPLGVEGLDGREEHGLFVLHVGGELCAMESQEVARDRGRLAEPGSGGGSAQPETLAQREMMVARERDEGGVPLEAAHFGRAGRHLAAHALLASEYSG